MRKLIDIRLIIAMGVMLIVATSSQASEKHDWTPCDADQPGQALYGTTLDVGEACEKEPGFADGRDRCAAAEQYRDKADGWGLVVIHYTNDLHLSMFKYADCARVSRVSKTYARSHNCGAEVEGSVRGDMAKAERESNAWAADHCK